MAEPLTYDFDGNACLRAQGCVGIPKTVQRNRRDLSPLYAVEHRSSEVPRIHRRAVSAGEDQVSLRKRARSRIAPVRPACGRGVPEAFPRAGLRSGAWNFFGRKLRVAFTRARVKARETPSCVGFAGRFTNQDNPRARLIHQKVG